MTKVKFATYYLKFKQDLACEGWENRESDFGALFEQDDSIVLGEEWPSPIMSETEASPQRVFNHRVYHLRCNPLITVMQFANNIDTSFESKFTPVVMKNEPSLFMLIDNRKDVRTTAIQNRRKAFSAPQRVAQRFSMSTPMSEEDITAEGVCIEAFREMFLGIKNYEKAKQLFMEIDYYLRKDATWKKHYNEFRSIIEKKDNINVTNNITVCSGATNIMNANIK